jgi:hypothetical protein
MPSVLMFNGSNAPLWLVLATAVVIGLLMVLVFRYASNQKAIGRAKDALKAHLLAVRLFQDQLPVVVRAYGKILLGTGTYLRLAFTPFLIAVVPITLLIIQMDRYLGWVPLQPSQAFLLEVRADTPEALDQINLHLPDGLVTTAPAVHILHDKTVVWRLEAKQAGGFDVDLAAAGQDVQKRVVVSSALERISPVKLRGDFWGRLFSSAEPALPDSSVIQAITVDYPERTIRLFGVEWNWIVLFFVVSLAAGFIFKSVLGIQI